MKHPAQRYPEHAKSRFYVNDECIVCGLCEDMAPSIFKVSEDGDHNFVHRQPDTKEEVELAEETLKSCPVDAICDDGETF